MSSPVAPTETELPAAVRSSWHRFLDTYEPLRTPLHRRARGRGRARPAPAVLDVFCAAFNARDLDGLTALLLDTAVVEVVGTTTQYGPEAARRTLLHGMLSGVRRLATADVNGGIDARFVRGALDAPVRVEARAHRGEWLLLHWYAHRDGDFVRAITRVEPDGDRVARLWSYFFTPDVIADACGELDVPCRSNGHRWWLTGTC